MPAPSRPWAVVVPVKGGSSAKSRLADPARPALATAFALDTIMAALATVGVERVVVVTSDPVVATLVRALDPGHRVVDLVPDPGVGLDAAARAGVDRARAEHFHRVAVLLGDHPGLTSTELEIALAAAATHRGAFVPDAAGTGTAMVALAAADADPTTNFGGGSAARHAAQGLARLDLDLPGLRLDVDEVTDLEAALAVGVGQHTARALRATLTIVQATIHSTGDEGGQALLDDGSLIDWDLASVAGSGLRHLRVGQRVSVELDDEDRRARRMWIVGIGAGQVIS
ncbi:MAG: 2-phospho-L-lactate guanylyltransferase [Actinobacteria bacterium]|nr:2-phospho-L-lactate guanylyltransferase [Actinomycetota bacterium]